MSATFRQWLAANGTSPAPNLPIALLSYDGFGLSARLSPEDGYRILAGPRTFRGQITNGPGAFDCIGLTPAPSAPPSAPVTDKSDAAGAGPGVLCAIPHSVQIFDGLSATLAITTRQVADALVLPTYAVAGTSGTGQVYVPQGPGAATIRNVTLGVTNGGLVQISSGLREGDKVLANPPTLSAS